MPYCLCVRLKAARNGEPFEADTVPDGFYLVGDTELPQTEWHTAIIEAVREVTHIAPPDAHGNIIGEPVQQEGVINYPTKARAPHLPTQGASRSLHTVGGVSPAPVPRCLSHVAPAPRACTLVTALLRSCHCRSSACARRSRAPLTPPLPRSTRTRRKRAPSSATSRKSRRSRAHLTIFSAREAGSVCLLSGIAGHEALTRPRFYM